MSRPTVDQESKQNIGDSEFGNLVVLMTWTRYISVFRIPMQFLWLLTIILGYIILGEISAENESLYSKNWIRILKQNLAW